MRPQKYACRVWACDVQEYTRITPLALAPHALGDYGQVMVRVEHASGHVPPFRHGIIREKGTEARGKNYPAAKEAQTLDKEALGSWTETIYQHSKPGPCTHDVCSTGNQAS
jgi:hypothetical protein